MSVVMVYRSALAEMRTAWVRLKKRSFSSIMKVWRGREVDETLAIHSRGKAVDVVESRYSYKGLCKRCGRVCRYFQLLYLRRSAGDPSGAAYRV